MPFFYSSCGCTLLGVMINTTSKALRSSTDAEFDKWSAISTRNEGVVHLLLLRCLSGRYGEHTDTCYYYYDWQDAPLKITNGSSLV